MSSILSIMTDEILTPHYLPERPQISTKLLGVYIFAFTPVIVKEEADCFKVHLLNVITNVPLNVYYRYFDTLEEATDHALHLKENGAIGEELCNEFSQGTVELWFKKIQEQQFNFIYNINDSTQLTYTDIFKWQMAAIDAGLEVRVISGKVFAAEIPLRLFTAILAYDSVMSQVEKFRSGVKTIESRLGGTFNNSDGVGTGHLFF